MDYVTFYFSDSLLSSECVSSVRLCVHAPVCVGQMFECLRVHCEEIQAASQISESADTTEMATSESVETDPVQDGHTVNTTSSTIDLTCNSVYQLRNSNRTSILKNSDSNESKINDKKGTSSEEDMDTDS